VSGGDLSPPKMFGMQATMIHTACYNGFYAFYELKQELLYLRTLTVKTINDKYPPIDGVNPVEEKDSSARYNDLNVFMPFTGKIQLGKDYADLLHKIQFDSFYKKPYMFNTVLDININEGKIVNVRDFSFANEQDRIYFNKNGTDWLVDISKALKEELKDFKL
jgi:hypothetical protein